MIVFGVYSTLRMNRFLVEVAARLHEKKSLGAFFVAWSSDAADELGALGQHFAYYPSPAYGINWGREDSYPPFSIETRDYDSAWIGEIAAATPGYWKSDVDGQREIRNALAVAEAVLTLMKPRLLVLWNGEHVGGRALRVVAERHGMPVLFVERGPLADTLLADRAGANGFASFAASSISDSEPAALDWARSRVVDYLRGNESAWRQPDENREENITRLASISRSCQLVFVPLQVSSDTNMVLHSPLFKTSAEFVEAVVSTYQHFPQYHLIIKNHPHEHDPVSAQLLRRFRNWTLLDKLSVKDILPICDHVVTNNSTVGLEALLNGKPVIQTGRAYYGGKCLTLEVDSVTALGQAIERVNSSGCPRGDREGATRLLAALRSGHHLFDMRLPNDVEAFSNLLERCTGEPSGGVTADLDLRYAVCSNVISGISRVDQYQSLIHRYRGLLDEISRTLPFRIAVNLRRLPVLRKYRRFQAAADRLKD